MNLEQSIKELINNTQEETINDIRKLFEEETYDEFFDKYEEVLDLSDIWEDAEEFKEAIEEEEIDVNTLLVWYLASENVLLVLDWSGEEEDGQVVEFINEKINQIYKLDLKLDAAYIYEMFEKGQYNSEPIKRGEHLPILFFELNKQLLKDNLEIVSFNTGSDEYFIAVLKEEVTKNLKDHDFNNVEIELFR